MKEKVTIERRCCERFFVFGATVRIEQKGLVRGKKAYSQQWPVKDLSRGGLCFYTNISFKPDRILKILLSVPEIEEEIEIIARVVWTSYAPLRDYEYQVGLEFAPFGEKGDFSNSIKILNILKRIENIYKNSSEWPQPANLSQLEEIISIFSKD